MDLYFEHDPRSDVAKLITTAMIPQSDVGTAIIDQNNGI